MLASTTFIFTSWKKGSRFAFAFVLENKVEIGVGGSLNFLAALRLFREGIRSVSPVDVGPPEGFESWILGVVVGDGDKRPSSIFNGSGAVVVGYLPVNKIIT